MPVYTIAELSRIYRQFVARHGGNPIYDPLTKTELLPDGAQWIGPRYGVDMAGMAGVGVEPPKGVDQLKQRQRYYKLRLKSEETAFNNFKGECERQMRMHLDYHYGCPPPPEDAEQQLMAGQQRIFELRCELRAVEVELERLPEAVARREYEEREHQRMQGLQQQFSDLRSLTPDAGGKAPPNSKKRK